MRIRISEITEINADVPVMLLADDYRRNLYNMLEMYMKMVSSDMPTREIIDRLKDDIDALSP